MSQERRIFLAVQTYVDGRKVIRRYSPDSPLENRRFQEQTNEAKEWLRKAKWPLWTHRFYIPDSKPFEVEHVPT
jgi:hypothetical protein